MKSINQEVVETIKTEGIRGFGKRCLVSAVLATSLVTGFGYCHRQGYAEMANKLKNVEQRIVETEGISREVAVEKTKKWVTYGEGNIWRRPTLYLVITFPYVMGEQDAVKDYKRQEKE